MPDHDLFVALDHYIDALFAPEDEPLQAALAEARAEGLPQIQVSPGQGKLLYLLAKLVGARRILEVGTLGGYSTIWLARALPSDGFMVTLELEPAHARVAAKSLHRAGLLEQVELIVGPALESLPRRRQGELPQLLQQHHADGAAWITDPGRQRDPRRDGVGPPGQRPLSGRRTVLQRHDRRRRAAGGDRAATGRRQGPRRPGDRAGEIGRTRAAARAAAA